jgi:hypothetical protein
MQHVMGAREKHERKDPALLSGDAHELWSSNIVLEEVSISGGVMGF